MATDDRPAEATSCIECRYRIPFSCRSGSGSNVASTGLFVFARGDPRQHRVVARHEQVGHRVGVAASTTKAHHLPRALVYRAAERGNTMVRSTNRPSGFFSGSPFSSHTRQWPPSQVEIRLPLANVQAPLIFQPPSTGTARLGGSPRVNPKVNTPRGSPNTSCATCGFMYPAAIPAQAHWACTRPRWRRPRRSLRPPAHGWPDSAPHRRLHRPQTAWSGRMSASQIASASVASFLLVLTNGRTYCGGISRTSCPSARNSRAQ